METDISRGSRGEGGGEGRGVWWGGGGMGEKEERNNQYLMLYCYHHNDCALRWAAIDVTTFRCFTNCGQQQGHERTSTAVLFSLSGPGVSLV